ncbi:MAG: hypothetical protein LBT16_11680 [Treponema sp.]|jgi:hypothetical protein|nr:hypothetical protein [Treponema sp.]
MSSIILLVFEGERTEPDIFNSIEKHFFDVSSGKTILRSSFKGEIYQLWKRIKDDEYFDTIELIKERDESIKDINRKQVSEIHLFFDHDAHSHMDSMPQAEYDKILFGMLNTFGDENELGKLWISYPMVEAIKHCKKNPNDCFKDGAVKISENTKYKDLVGHITDFQNIKKINRGDWIYLIAINMQRAYCLIMNDYKLIDDYNEIKAWFENNTTIRIIIHEKQIEKFINPKSEVAVLSPFPFFLLNYFGNPLFNEVKALDIIKNCSFYCFW